MVLLRIAFAIFRPGSFMDQIAEPFIESAPTEIASNIQEANTGDNLRLRIRGVDDVGDEREWVTLLPVPDGATGEERVEAASLTLRTDGDKAIIDDVAFDSAA